MRSALRFFRAWTIRTTTVPDPWSPGLALGRSLLFAAMGVTLLATPAWALFTPTVGNNSTANCEDLASLSLFCSFPAVPTDALTKVAGIALMTFASGFLPAVTALTAAWILVSIPVSATLIDGGDQLAGILGVLLLPISLCDWRLHQWRSASHAQVRRLRAVTACTGWVAVRLQVIVVYLDASFGKLSVPEWANGSAIYLWERHPNFGAPGWAQPIVLPLTSIGWISALVTFGVMAIEFSVAASPLLPVRVRLRVILPTAMALHVGIVLFMGVTSFSLVMFSALLLLLIPLDWQPSAVAGHIYRRTRKEIDAALP